MSLSIIGPKLCTIDKANPDVINKTRACSLNANIATKILDEVVIREMMRFFLLMRS